MAEFKLDELKLGAEKTITKQFEADEKIILSTKITKYNDQKKNQERTFLLTNKYLYNLKKTTIKRKILVGKVYAMTVGTINNEFVIHVADEYDYRYSHATKREMIMNLLDQIYRTLHNGETLPIHHRDDLSLFKYTTKKEDMKKGINKVPNALVEDDQKNNSPDSVSKNTIFSKDKGREVCIEDFSWLKELGKGAFGKVILVKKKDTDELYALKSIKKIDIIERGKLEHAKTEQMVLEQLRHPFLVSLDYCFITKDRINFVMQFMKGGELFKYLRQEGRFSEPRYNNYIKLTNKVALALSHLHKNNVLYRDMKPENVLMDEKGYVCLADFGMAKVIKEGEEAKSFCGTPEYLAPEVINNVGHGKEADWWELGIFTYELLFGRTPFRNQNFSLLCEAISMAQLSFPQDIQVSREAKDFIEKCLVKNQKSRMGSAEDFEEVKGHPWLADIDWGGLLNKTVEPPFKPVIQSETSGTFIKEENIYDKSINMVIANS